MNYEVAALALNLHLVKIVRCVSGIAEKDENCCHFLNRCLPEAFGKLLRSNAVHKWGGDIHEGIFTMLHLLLELMVERLKLGSVPRSLLPVLSMSLNPESEYHIKNRGKVSTRQWHGQPYGVTPESAPAKEPYGWLVDLINLFGEKGGFQAIRDKAEEERTDLEAVALLLHPLGVCSEFLNPLALQALLVPQIQNLLSDIRDLPETELKDKRVAAVPGLLGSLKLMLMQLTVEELHNGGKCGDGKIEGEGCMDGFGVADELRLQILLRLLRSPHFHCKMLSLREVSRLIEQSWASRPIRGSVKQDALLDWLADNSILSIALEGNIDQAQYCERIRGIVEVMGSRLSLEEISVIWKMQSGQSPPVMDNLHAVVAVAAAKLGSKQLEHLLALIQKSWESESDRVRQKLLSLLGRIGRDSRFEVTTAKVLQVLWSVAHGELLSPDLIERALSEHFGVLSDSYPQPDTLIRCYAFECMQDVKLGAFVVPALRHLLQMTRSISKNGYHKQDKSVLQELKAANDVVSLLTNSLVNSHKAAVKSAAPGKLNRHVIVDGRFTHEEYLEAHLSFLAFFLVEASLYLPLPRAQLLWETLVSNPTACDLDRQLCFDWFSRGLGDLDSETQKQLFRKHVLELYPSQLLLSGFNLFKALFEAVNLSEQQLKKQGTQLSVEKTDLAGMGFLWRVAMETEEEEIADEAVCLIIDYSYSRLNPRLRKDPASLHRTFITDWLHRLEDAYTALVDGRDLHGETESGPGETDDEFEDPKMQSEICASNMPNCGGPSVLVVERLLLLAEKYVVTIEDACAIPRSFLPHGASYHGQPLTLLIFSTNSHTPLTLQAHQNETMGSVRARIATELGSTPEAVQLFANDSLLLSIKDHKLLHQLQFSNPQSLTAKMATGVAVGGAADAMLNKSFMADQEKFLPGRVMALECGVFNLLYKLARLRQARVTVRVRQLLLLMPTDPAVDEALDRLGRKVVEDGQAMGSECEVMSEAANQAVGESGKEMACRNSSPTLHELFNFSTPGMSSFRVLYNLEVLSSKLIPTLGDEMERGAARSFCNNFLHAGGLSLVMDVMQRDSPPAYASDDTRQDIYAICLQLARFLLMGDATPGDSGNMATVPGPLEARPFQRPSRCSSGRASERTSIRVDEVTPAARLAVQTMDPAAYSSTVSGLVRLAWAAAVGKLVPTANPLMYGQLGGWQRQGSTGSSGSEESERSGWSAFGSTCVTLDSKSSLIARDALSLLIACLQLRKELLGSFFSLRHVADFIIDLLLHSPCHEVRRASCEQFHTLAQMDVGSTPEVSSRPDLFLLNVLLQAHLPLWASSTALRGQASRLFSHCTEYFDLRCLLLDNHTFSSLEALNLNPTSMLEDEITWLSNFDPGELGVGLAGVGRKADVVGMPTEGCGRDALLAGHLKLTKTLLSLCGQEKERLGCSLIPQLLDEFLFPAANLIVESNPVCDCSLSLSHCTPKCSGPVSRRAAFEVLLVLADGSLPNLQLLTTHLTTLHHQPDPGISREFEVLPPVDGRSTAGFVGLRNGGATCYMNAIFQQLYMQPGLPEALLAVEGTSEVDSDEGDEGKLVLAEVQSIFAHLLDSLLQYYVPANFWKVFKLWNRPIHIREQQDAYEFFTSLVDQLDEQLKKLGREQVFKKTYQGIFSDQKVCRNCPHKFEREESFLALDLGVTACPSLEACLEQFVRAEALEGENAYYCEICKEKRPAMKRMRLKVLPPVLVVHLMRFGFDWESGRPLKYDEQIRFPFELDMAPYTVEGLAPPGSNGTADGSIGDTHIITSDTNGSAIDDDCGETNEGGVVMFDLVGVVVHSGQAHAGHYYSFIKDRRSTDTATRSNLRGPWLKFNDTSVEEFSMNDSSLEYECFGGEYYAQGNEMSPSQPEVRRKFWNAYLLFYQRRESHTQGVSPSLCKKSRVLTSSVPSSPDLSPQSSPLPHRPNDRLRLLDRLVKRGERRGIFGERMPAPIAQAVREENLKFLRNRDVYNQDYFKLILSLVSINSTKTNHSHYAAMSECGLRLAIPFLFNTFLRTHKQLWCDVGEWLAVAGALVANSVHACQWLVNALGAMEGREMTRVFLLECPVREVRSHTAAILDLTLNHALSFSSSQELTGLETLLDSLLSLLDRDVAENFKSCSQFFGVLDSFARKGPTACALLFRLSAFQRLLDFLLGTQPPQTRRWPASQSREFSSLHTTLAVMALHCDLSAEMSVDAGSFERFTTCLPYSCQELLPLASSVRNALLCPDSQAYIREILLAMREHSAASGLLLQLLSYVAFCNEHFSASLLQQVKTQLEGAPAHELTSIFNLLNSILAIEDPLQLERIRFTLEREKGILALMHHCSGSDSSRCYQCIKFISHIAQRCSAAKEYFRGDSYHLLWAVQWLQNKMSDHYSTPQSNVSNETSMGKVFQRTMSAQDTLAGITALLNEKDPTGSGEGSPEGDANGNGSDKISEQGSESPMSISMISPGTEETD
uniref:ubiquitinyl hydrolase 1 n=1 Tax=Eptatretus burgeri TaxID=7764 RepID=A0A8C4R0F6_EPTBU